MNTPDPTPTPKISAEPGFILICRGAPFPAEISTSGIVARLSIRDDGVETVHSIAFEDGVYKWPDRVAVQQTNAIAFRPVTLPADIQDLEKALASAWQEIARLQKKYLGR